MCSSAWRNKWLQGQLWNLRDWTWTTLQLSSTLMDRTVFCKTCACILHCQWLRMQILVGNYQICGACSLINVPLASSVPTWNALRLNYDCTASVSVGARGPALVQCQDFQKKMKWLFRVEKKESKTTTKKKNEKEGQEAKNRKRKRWIRPCEERVSSLPLPWQVLSGGVLFLGSHTFFKKNSEHSVCHKPFVLRSGAQHRV